MEWRKEVGLAWGLLDGGMGERCEVGEGVRVAGVRVRVCGLWVVVRVGEWVRSVGVGVMGSGLWLTDVRWGRG